MDRVLEYEIPSEYDGANITTVLKQHFKISTNLIKDLKKYKEGIQRTQTCCGFGGKGRYFKNNNS